MEKNENSKYGLLDSVLFRKLQENEDISQGIHSKNNKDEKDWRWFVANGTGENTHFIACTYNFLVAVSKYGFGIDKHELDLNKKFVIIDIDRIKEENRKRIKENPNSQGLEFFGENKSEFEKLNKMGKAYIKSDSEIDISDYNFDEGIRTDLFNLIPPIFVDMLYAYKLYPPVKKEDFEQSQQKILEIQDLLLGRDLVGKYFNNTENIKENRKLFEEERNKKIEDYIKNLVYKKNFNDLEKDFLYLQYGIKIESFDENELIKAYNLLNNSNIKNIDELNIILKKNNNFGKKFNEFTMKDREKIKRMFSFLGYNLCDKVTIAEVPNINIVINVLNSKYNLSSGKLKSLSDVLKYKYPILSKIETDTKILVETKDKSKKSVDTLVPLMRSNIVKKIIPSNLMNKEEYFAPFFPMQTFYKDKDRDMEEFLRDKFLPISFANLGSNISFKMNSKSAFTFLKNIQFKGYSNSGNIEKISIVQKKIERGNRCHCNKEYKGNDEYVFEYSITPSEIFKNFSSIIFDIKDNVPILNYNSIIKDSLEKKGITSEEIRESNINRENIDRSKV